ncbi:pyrroloquinoline quinone biosynthesis protein PqqF [Pantoea sp. Bo_2]|uniref:Coenzyme PQQ synthesis protein F n=1 Tax=Candidatus Pantoea gossypiicola TaxID=2608008 RepID=A0AB34CLG5_9GAMM|nr:MULTISPECIES: pyrroloquinoline quinone biosynthesis protein PqqF [Pantoea]KAA5933152.1 pyrroloquinoline quinone biosynthesis protein PqqF [Pantoea sp. VH_8]KAA5937939.1 pyrroloquinoline quinone biosynthesis protein PqqF [Pantoea sp. VH_4]KAA5950274.1 pyrroloquinoline quinone biosynthesis protein PqqF [Pantoea sp. VH_3]KAA5955647.1 pyrroloquinoline quinone biosynthesis protein PqqF [Pantoea sp. VH_25]KAA5960190.1 pyrroloquinoline quinone biosynthesis protein PqqF [Pantoea sp. VH_24]
MTTRGLVIEGLTVELVHQADASQAAALIRVGAGSHDEPDRWPGLAHLLEHLLFTGSTGWPDEGRLMSWIQTQGGRVNATTLARRSAYFFEVTPSLLADGLARLQDMLVSPLLDNQAIAQEVAVIDAEYQLLQRHEPSRIEAALLHAAETSAEFQRFHVGSRASFGDELSALQRALRQFHQRYYVASNMRLWLQGPQSLDELEQLAHQFAAALPAGQWRQDLTPPQLNSDTCWQLAETAQAALWRTWLLDNSDGVTLWREFLLDEAPGSLLATLREQGLAEGLELKWIYQAEDACWLALGIETSEPEKVNHLVNGYLTALRQTTAQQHLHYHQLAYQQFVTLSPLEQLRQRAIGFTPDISLPALQPLLDKLTHAPGTVLCCTSQPAREQIVTQGFTLALTACEPAQDERLPAARFTFYPLDITATPSPLPAQAVALPHHPSEDPQATLILRPEFYSTFTAETGEALGRRLRPLFAALRHQGGHGSWQETEGVWQLTVRLTSDQAVADQALSQIVSALALPVEANLPLPVESIAIRALLRQLPYQLAANVTPGCWRAALKGGDAMLHSVIARRLSALSLPVNPDTSPKRMTTQTGMTRLPHASADNALLLFIPLQRPEQLAALRALALIYEPRFFQRYRVEQQIGYVVSSRYMRCADEDGVLFALQSPDYSALSLLRYCRNFLRSLNETLAGCDLVALKARLLSQQAEQPLALLRRENGLAEPDAAQIAALTLADLQQLHRTLIQDRRRWRVLFTGRNA